MKKLPLAPLPLQSLIEEDELAPVEPIRTETTLTRYPIHRIAKKGQIKIKQTTKNDRGKAVTTWEVRNPPGPLAYKLDTIIINRRIDEMRNKGEIKRLIKLGSLRDICEELGINPNGKATNAIKEALRENAFAGITAKLDYKSGDGAERTFEFSTTRYTLILTGEKLPNEKRADAVYIELHPRYHEMLNFSKTRPLDYKYLRELPPSAQRLYELLSFVMFGALKHGRPVAQMMYSEFCANAPLTRYEEWDRVRPQMWKIHKPHIDAGYLKGVEFEENTDKDGVIDWLMRYTPGRRAKNEYREFTTKKLNTQPVKPTPTLVSSQPLALPFGEDDAALVGDLVAAGVTLRKAQELVVKHRASVERELEAWPHRDQARMKDPAAWLIGAIESGDYSVPAPVQKKRNAKALAAEQQQEEAQAERLRAEYNVYLKNELVTLQHEHTVLYEAFAQSFAREWESMREIVGEDNRDVIKLQHLEWYAGWRKDFPVQTLDEWQQDRELSR